MRRSPFSIYLYAAKLVMLNVSALFEMTCPKKPLPSITTSRLLLDVHPSKTSMLKFY